MEELLYLFYQTIKDARISAGMTQDVLAKQTGVTPGYIMAIENENKHPRMPVLLVIIHTSKISADTKTGHLQKEQRHTDDADILQLLQPQGCLCS